MRGEKKYCKSINATKQIDKTERHKHEEIYAGRVFIIYEAKGR